MKKLVEHLNGFNCWNLNGEQSIVYLIEIGDDKYIGSTEKAKYRLSSHVNSLLEGRHLNKKIQQAFDKNKVFTIYLIEECLSKEEAFVKEKNYIRELLPNLNHTLYFKEWELPLYNKEELIILLSNIFSNALSRMCIRLKRLEKCLGLNKGWLKKMSIGIVDMNPEQFSNLLKILGLSVVSKNNELYIRFIKDNKNDIL